MNIGSVWADNIEDPDSQDSIRLGNIKGDGLLGKVVAAIRELNKAIHRAEFWGEVQPACVRNGRELAWLNLYHALKAVEEATNE